MMDCLTKNGMMRLQTRNDEESEKNACAALSRVRLPWGGMKASRCGALQTKRLAAGQCQRIRYLGGVCMLAVVPRYLGGGSASLDCQ